MEHIWDKLKLSKAVTQLSVKLAQMPRIKRKFLLVRWQVAQNLYLSPVRQIKPKVLCIIMLQGQFSESIKSVKGPKQAHSSPSTVYKLLFHSIMYRVRGSFNLRQDLKTTSLCHWPILLSLDTTRSPHRLNSATSRSRMPSSLHIRMSILPMQQTEFRSIANLRLKTGDSPFNKAITP